MTKRYTPGPWHLVGQDVRDSDEDNIVTIPYRDDPERAEANARLIAHAWAIPQLVAAVKAMQGACDEWAAEFTQKTRAMNWGKVNDAYMQAGAALRAVKG